MITPEQLKKVAEYMGLSPRYADYNSGRVLEAKVGSYRWIKYNPLQNSDQCLELMEKFKLDLFPTKYGWCVRKYDQEYLGFPVVDVTGKTINEAVTLAAIAYVEGLENE